MTTREEMAGAAFEAWWAAMPQERANELAVCGEQIRSGLKAAVKLGYVAARTRDGELRERLKKLVEEWRDKRRVEFEMKLDGFVAATDALMDCADGVKALLKETET